MKIGQAPDAVLRGVIDDTYLADMRERNRARAERAIQRMGAKWCCHPANRPIRRRRQIGSTVLRVA